MWRLDRLALSCGTGSTQFAALDGRGIGFRWLPESLDTTTSGGRWCSPVFGALAKFEGDLISDRTLWLEAARQRTRRGGRPLAMTPPMVRQAERTYADKRLVSEIAAGMLDVGRATVYSAVGTTRPGSPAAGGPDEQRSPC